MSKKYEPEITTWNEAFILLFTKMDENTRAIQSLTERLDKNDRLTNEMSIGNCAKRLDELEDRVLVVEKRSEVKQETKGNIFSTIMIVVATLISLTALIITLITK